MTDTNQNELTEEAGGELLPDIYVEKATNLLYEVRFFPDFVIVRPATPSFYLAIRKTTQAEFIAEFEEFYGDKQIVREFLRDQPADFIVEIR